MRPLLGALLSLTLVLGGLLAWDDLARAAATSGMNAATTSRTSVRAIPQETEIAPMPWSWWLGLTAVGVALFDLIALAGRRDDEAAPVGEHARPRLWIIDFGTHHRAVAGHRGGAGLSGRGLAHADERVGPAAERAAG